MMQECKTRDVSCDGSNTMNVPTEDWRKLDTMKDCEFVTLQKN